MPMLKRGYGAVRNLRCKSGARFPPSTVAPGSAHCFTGRLPKKAVQ